VLRVGVGCQLAVGTSLATASHTRIVRQLTIRGLVGVPALSPILTVYLGTGFWVSAVESSAMGWLGRDSPTDRVRAGEPSLFLLWPGGHAARQTPCRSVRHVEAAAVLQDHPMFVWRNHPMACAYVTIVHVQGCHNCARMSQLCKEVTIVQGGHNCARRSQLCKDAAQCQCHLGHLHKCYQGAEVGLGFFLGSQ
jgi:hypothetical protein